MGGSSSRWSPSSGSSPGSSGARIARRVRLPTQRADRAAHVDSTNGERERTAGKPGTREGVGVPLNFKIPERPNEIIAARDAITRHLRLLLYFLFGAIGVFVLLLFWFAWASRR